MKRITFRSGLNGGTKHVNGATKPKAITPSLRTNKPRESDNPTVNLTIGAVRALGVLCLKIGDILDCASRERGLSEQRAPEAVGEIRGVSLDPSTFVDPEEEQGNAA
jgi:hypothetical protein